MRSEKARGRDGGRELEGEFIKARWGKLYYAWGDRERCEGGK